MHAFAHIYQDSDSERPTKVVSKSKSRKHSTYTHFSKRPKLRSLVANQNSKGSFAEYGLAKLHFWQKNCGDLITADHKVFNVKDESRNNHRYAVVVQDLAIQWIQSYPCKTKTSQDTEKSLRIFLEPSYTPKVFFSQFIRLWKILSRSIKESSFLTPRRAVRRLKECTFHFS